MVSKGELSATLSQKPHKERTVVVVHSQEPTKLMKCYSVRKLISREAKRGMMVR